MQVRRRVERASENGANPLATIMANHHSSLICRLTHVSVRIRIELTQLDGDVRGGALTVAHTGNRRAKTRRRQVFRYVSYLAQILWFRQLDCRTQGADSMPSRL